MIAGLAEAGDTEAESRLALGIHAASFQGLPASSALAGLSLEEQYAAVRDAGFEAIQSGEDDLAREAGLERSGLRRVIAPGEADAVAQDARRRGHTSVTLHLGTGFESDAEADRLIEEVLTASADHGVPLYVETHRATVTQDPWRTLRLIERHPDLRFTGDFSHWYTGVELVYGDLDAKLDALQPVFDRVRFLHGRIGTPGSIQVDVGDGRNLPYVDHFTRIWTRTFEAFLRHADPDERIVFAPELLSAANYYARLIPSASGEAVEEGDRWEQSLVLCTLALEAFAAAERAVAASWSRVAVG